MITVKDYCEISGCSPWFNLDSFTYEEVCEFLTKLGYNIFVHYGIIKTRIVNSISGTGETQLSDPVNMERKFIVAVMKGHILPYNVNDLGYPFLLRDVFNFELKKKLLL